MTDFGSNLQFIGNQAAVDKLNAEFYGDIKYPWAPCAFEKVRNPNFWTQMLSQDMGYWDGEIIPKSSKIWVAGCGTNQAIFTALKFPNSTVVASDLSRESLEICQKNAMQLHINNIDFRNESINESNYIDYFDYVICTGVIHHNSDPTIALDKLSKSLKPNGVMELMVYNKYHRIIRSAFQLAVRILAQCTEKPNLDKEFRMAEMIASGYKENAGLNELLNSISSSKEVFADALLQPVEHSYTTDSLNKMITSCNLELLHFCIDQFSKANGNLDWNLRFAEDELQEIYYDLPDIQRWHVTNLLQGEKSPMLWFYVQRKDSTRIRKTEKQLCQDFLNMKLRRVKEMKDMFVMGDNGTYSETTTVDFPPKSDRILSGNAKNLYLELDEKMVMSEVFRKCKINTNFAIVNMMRCCLATSSNPYLQSYI